MTPVDAERAFAADAQRIGQWTAFRKWAAPDATMFDPQPVKVGELLKDAKDPIKSVEWWPTASYVSCDGKFAVNTGGWRRPNGSVGYFTTVWVRQPDGGWRWTIDAGDTLAVPRPAPRRPLVRRASCPRYPTDMLVPRSGAVPPPGSGASHGTERAGDGTLSVWWETTRNGADRQLTATMLIGGRAVTVIDDRVAAKPQ